VPRQGVALDGSVAGAQAGFDEGRCAGQADRGDRAADRRLEARDVAGLGHHPRQDEQRRPGRPVVARHRPEVGEDELVVERVVRRGRPEPRQLVDVDEAGRHAACRGGPGDGGADGRLADPDRSGDQSDAHCGIFVRIERENP
jgi:hypothetical protein